MGSNPASARSSRSGSPRSARNSPTPKFNYSQPRTQPRRPSGPAQQQRESGSRSPSPLFHFTNKPSTSVAAVAASAAGGSGGGGGSRQLPAVVHVQHSQRSLPPAPAPSKQPVQTQQSQHHLRKLPPVPGVATRTTTDTTVAPKTTAAAATTAGSGTGRKMPTITQQPTNKVNIIQKIQPTAGHSMKLITTQATSSTDSASKYLSKQFASIGDDDNSENENENWL